MRIVVIGAGIVGASCALELLKDGHDVTVLDPHEPGGRHAASYGHGCWISPASVVPMSMPGLWKQVPGYLLNPGGPLVIRWRYIFKLLPWLLSFLRAGATVPRVERTALALGKLLSDSPARHLALAAAIGRPDLIRQDGLLYAYTNRKAFESDSLSWRLRKMTGLKWTELDRAALSEREPDLNARYQFGVLAEEGAHCVDPAAYVSGLIFKARELGAEFIQSRAQSFAFDGSRLVSVTTDTVPIECEVAVVACGIWSKRLASLAGDKVLLESERGYHGVLTEVKNIPRHPVMPADGRMGNTPTAKGLRLSGQVELATVDAPPNWDRVDILIQHALTTYPSLRASDISSIDKWMGHRPSTPDGLPVIGPSSRSPDVIYAFGHGHIGFASGPMTARLVADHIAGSPIEEISRYSARRFRNGKDKK
ncbi:FAD-binding oxidoreductase [Neorhizobium galegae]|uniref:FAD-binding oxidoreductase n=1 Tax=Neorhizobium galegae TaxID=399 RepID=A0A6A1TII3_NEOGA|nr:FAD-binding oxidoreductase [Neorhizobium galegae]KAB1082162.1 FAD-binding oxidoreductase [Neorhizobium galegae]